MSYSVAVKEVMYQYDINYDRQTDRLLDISKVRYVDLLQVPQHLDEFQKSFDSDTLPLS